jgi:hypothetical protein
MLLVRELCDLGDAYAVVLNKWLNITIFFES